MKAINRIICITAVLALLFSIVSCSRNSSDKDNNDLFAKKITVGNIEVSIREDMTLEEENERSSNYIWNGYSMEIHAIDAKTVSDYKFNGNTADDILLNAAENGSSASELMHYEDTNYIEFTKSNADDESTLHTCWVLEEGYEYYTFEFITSSENDDTYLDEYKKIISSVHLVEMPPKTIDITYSGLILTVDGDAFEITSENCWVCSRYSLSVFKVTNHNLASLSANEMARAAIEHGNEKNAANETPEIMTTPGGSAYYEAINNGLYCTYYYRRINDTLYYFGFATMFLTEQELKLEFNNIVSRAYEA